MHSRRSIRSYLSIAALSGAALLAAGVLALGPPDTPARAGDMGYGRGVHGYGPPQGYAHHDRHGHDGICGGRAAGMLKHLDGVVPDLMNLDAGRQKAWDELLASADSARAKVKDVCADRPDRDATAPERLAHMEAVMAAGLDGVREVRPRFEAFYAGLSERQRQGLDELMSHRGRRFGALHDRMGDGARDETRDPVETP